MSVEPVTAPVPTSDELALERTRIAHERTLMAWIRTSMSMVSFGFTIYEFFNYLGEAIAGAAGTRVPIAGPRILGLTLIALGTVALIVAAVQHARSLRRLGPREGRGARSLALDVAILMSIGGVVVFCVIVFSAFRV